MRSAERDALVARQTVALERQADELTRRRREAEAAELAAHKPPLRRLFGGERGAVAILRSIPGFAGLWERVVPERAILTAYDRDHVRWRIVLCECGEQVALRPGAIGECGCDRFFFATGATIRVWRES